MHRCRYHGVYAPRSKWRKDVVPEPPEVTTNCEHHGDGGGGDVRGADLPNKRYSWARLLKRVFKVDVLKCSKCGADGMQRVAFILKPDAIRKILDSVGLPADSPKSHPPKLAAQGEFDFEAA